MSFTYYLLAFLLISSISSAPQEDLVNLSKIPAKYNISYKGPIYSGFLPSTSSNRLHYVFVPSESSPASSPVVLWLNGGPGCSSMEGFVNENGPFYFKDWSSETVPNDYSWNKISNLLYIESPSKVGFSTGQSNHNDAEVAQENIAALISFFNKFPEYKKNKFFISGESYAGIYIPTLADKVLTYNQSASSALKINLNGFLVGNGATHPEFDLASAALEFQYGHGLYSEEMKKKIDQHCGTEPPYDVQNLQCVVLQEEIRTKTTNINVYDIYRDCFPPSNTEVTEEMINTVEQNHLMMYKIFNV
jgi:carboxypeptidase C (cathepsin A)